MSPLVYKITKYATLFILHALVLYLLLPLGDFCSGFVEGFGSFLLTGLFIAAFAVFTVIDLSGHAGEKRVDYISLAWLGLFVVSLFAVISAGDRKFWTSRTLEAETQDEPGRSGKLILYSNNSFSAEKRDLEWSCTWQGEYEIRKSVIILRRDDLVSGSDSVFATEYQIDLKNNALVPAAPGFQKMQIMRTDMGFEEK